MEKNQLNHNHTTERIFSEESLTPLEIRIKLYIFLYCFLLHVLTELSTPHPQEIPISFVEGVWIFSWTAHFRLRQGELSDFQVFAQGLTHLFVFAFRWLWFSSHSYLLHHPSQAHKSCCCQISSKIIWQALICNSYMYVPVLFYGPKLFNW